MTVDLRSDTVSQPTAAMKAAMAAAPLGDDVLGDDPTVAALEARCAAISGKDAALFVPSGTMANLLALRVNTQPGDEVVLHEDAHPIHYEAGGAAHVAGVMLCPVPGARGQLDPQDVEARLRPHATHAAPPTLLWVEDTANRGGGAVHPVERLDALAALAEQRQLRAHLDGARQWNAAVASGLPIDRRVRGFDTVSMCFSKGLGCPAGSVLCGDQPSIDRARRFRKMLGGAMRQSGMLAAAALYALDHHRERLADDHRRARALADGLRARGFVAEPPETNIVHVDTPAAPAFAARLDAIGVRVFAIAPQRIRLVVHLGVDDAGVEHAIHGFVAARG